MLPRLWSVYMNIAGVIWRPLLKHLTRLAAAPALPSDYGGTLISSALMPTTTSSTSVKARPRLIETRMGRLSERRPVAGTGNKARVDFSANARPTTHQPLLPTTQCSGSQCRRVGLWT